MGSPNKSTETDKWPDSPTLVAEDEPDEDEEDDDDEPDEAEPDEDDEEDEPDAAPLASTAVAVRTSAAAAFVFAASAVDVCLDSASRSTCTSFCADCMGSTKSPPKRHAKERAQQVNLRTGRSRALKPHMVCRTGIKARKQCQRKGFCRCAARDHVEMRCRQLQRCRWEKTKTNVFRAT
jgi:hypothetical protein